MRIITAHPYHRIDYEQVWVTPARRRSRNGRGRPALAPDPSLKRASVNHNHWTKFRTPVGLFCTRATR